LPEQEYIDREEAWAGEAEKQRDTLNKLTEGEIILLCWPCYPDGNSLRKIFIIPWWSCAIIQWVSRMNFSLQDISGSGGVCIAGQRLDHQFPFPWAQAMKY